MKEVHNKHNRSTHGEVPKLGAKYQLWDTLIEYNSCSKLSINCLASHESVIRITCPISPLHKTIGGGIFESQ